MVVNSEGKETITREQTRTQQREREMQQNTKYTKNHGAKHTPDFTNKRYIDASQNNGEREAIALIWEEATFQFLIF